MQWLDAAYSSSGGGKGQPGTTTYSYSASFAVALSSRPIVAVGRIWADGNLLRGAAGDWKQATGFRLHAGGEDQPVDPLIAAREGAGLAPAHRGIAYAVFEDLALAEFGNRIPSLTFEVIADPAAPAIGAIAGAVSDGVVHDAGGGAATLAGFSAYGERAAVVVDLLARAAGGWIAPGVDGLRLLGSIGAPVTVADAGVGHAPRTLAIRPVEAVARQVSLAHYDPARDWQIGVQSAVRPGAGTRSERVEVPAALSAGAARTMAEAMLARAEAERRTRTVALDIAFAAVAPGALVRVEDEDGVWRVRTAAIEAMAVVLDLVPVAPGTVPVASTPGRVVPAPDRAVGETVVVAFELPALDDALLTQPQLTIAAAGTAPGWRRAALLYSLDDGASWFGAGATALPAVIGDVAVPPGEGADDLIDRANRIDVTLLHDAMTLESADMAAIGRGANLALVGGELIQFLDARQTGSRQWRLSNLLRARRGMRATHGPDERFVLIARESLVTVPLPSEAIGRTIRVLASGAGDTAGPAAGSAAIAGRSVAPPSPVHLRAMPDESGGAIVRWTRRSRLGFAWRDGRDAPLGEERESYRVIVATPAGERNVVMAEPRLVVTAAERAAGATVSVRQTGTVAESDAARIAIP